MTTICAFVISILIGKRNNEICLSNHEELILYILEYPKIPISPFVIPSQEEEEVKLGRYNFTFSKVIFECHANDTQPNYEYNVRWYINDLEITEARANNLTQTDVDDGLGKMKEDDWTSKFRPNFIVNCSIQVNADRYGLPSPEHHSEQFFAGIEVF